MIVPEIHLMRVERLAEARTVRYVCPTCGRCLEDRPDGLVLVHRGDQAAVHRGGMLAGMDTEVSESDEPGAVRH